MRKTRTTIRKLMASGAVCVAILLATNCDAQNAVSAAQNAVSAAQNAASAAQNAASAAQNAASAAQNAVSAAQNEGACAESSKAHMPFITCQPLDVVVALPGPGKPDPTATFSIGATGETLSYQWYAKKLKSTEFEAVPMATGPQLTINPVKRDDFGLYYCAVANESPDGTLPIVQSRLASLGGIPAGMGGTFVPCDWPVSGGAGSTICQHPVSAYYDRFPTNEIPTTGQTGLKCQIINRSANVPIQNTDYYLQFYVTAMNRGCMTNVAGDTTHVAYSVTPGSTYTLTVYFISGHAPPAGTVLELQGDWLP